MNPLIHAEVGMLYTTDFQFLKKIKYTRNSDSYTFIFSSMPETPLPRQVYLMPGEDMNDYTSFLCTTTGVFSEFYVPQTDRTWYLTETETFDLPDYRAELRVNLSFPLEITTPDVSETTTISVVDISVGGLKFITDKAFSVDTTFSFIFTKGSEPVLINALILKRYPARTPDVYCYGCRFLDLTQAAESVIRGFIFKENLIQAKSHRRS